jgi:hypothetical protein
MPCAPVLVRKCLAAAVVAGLHDQISVGAELRDLSQKTLEIAGFAVKICRPSCMKNMQLYRVGEPI